MRLILSRFIYLNMFDDELPFPPIFILSIYMCIFHNKSVDCSSPSHLFMLFYYVWCMSC